MTKTITRSALFPYSAESIYQLINDVEAYPDYMDGCVGATILEQTDSMMEAELELQKAGLSYTLTTRNQLQPPNRVLMQLVEGPFKRFQGEWQIDVLSEQACKAILTINYSFNNPILAAATKGLVKMMADNLVQAVIKRAKETLGGAN